MGLSDCFPCLRKHASDTRILIAGLDHSGKTTILYQLVHGRKIDTGPTYGLNDGIVHCNGLQIALYDVGGNVHTRTLWSMLIAEMDALIFVVECCNPKRLGEASDELRDIYLRKTDDDKWKSLDIPLLILTNQHHTRYNVSNETVMFYLGTSTFPVSNYTIMQADASTGCNLENGLFWIVEQLTRNDSSDYEPW